LHGGISAVNQTRSLFPLQGKYVIFEISLLIAQLSVLANLILYLQFFACYINKIIIDSIQLQKRLVLLLKTIFTLHKSFNFSEKSNIFYLLALQCLEMKLDLSS